MRSSAELQEYLARHARRRVRATGAAEGARHRRRRPRDWKFGIATRLVAPAEEAATARHPRLRHPRPLDQPAQTMIYKASRAGRPRRAAARKHSAR